MILYREIPLNAFECHHVNEEQGHTFFKSNRVFQDHWPTDTYFLLTNRISIDCIEGQLGNTYCQEPFFNQINTVYSYFLAYKKGEKVYFTFDKRTLYQLINIFPANPLRLTLKMINENFQEMEKDKQMGQKITIHAGDGNTITTGNNNYISTSITLNKGDLATFQKELAKHSIEEADILEISEIVQTEKPDIKGRFGSKTKGWLSKMLNKSIDGGWEIGIATAGGFLTELLKAYFGIK